MTVYLDPSGQRFGLPTYPYRLAPSGLATRRQLRTAGLRPGGQPIAVQILWWRGRRVAYLYRLDMAKPKRTATPAQLRAIAKGPRRAPDLFRLRPDQALLHPAPLRRLPRLPLREPVMTTRTQHTRWCARDHRCNLGEHRSEPASWTTPYGAVVATLVQTDTGSAHLELRLTVRIPADDPAALRRAAAIASGVETAIRSAITSGGTR